MAVQTYNLGTVTAYADAKVGGYTGTKEEWQALMASYASTAETTIAAKDAAVTAQGIAETAATNAATSASAAAESARTLTIDDTLTQTGQAADAKVTGDEISQLNTHLIDSIDVGYVGEIPVMIERGRIQGGSDTTSKYYVRSDFFTSDGIILFKARTTLSTVYIYEYLSDGTYNNKSYSMDSTTGTIKVDDPTGKKYRFCYTHSPQYEIPADQINECYADFIVLKKKSDVLKAVESNAEAIASTAEAVEELEENTAKAVIDSDTLSGYGLFNNLPLSWKVGYINSSTGQESSGTGGIISPDFVTLNDVIIIRKIADSVLQIYSYQSDGTFVGRTGFDNGHTQLKFAITEGYKYKFCFYLYPSESVADVDRYKKLIGISYDIIPALAHFSDVAGKKWATLGDSLTDPVTLSGYSGEETKNYTNIVAERLGLALTNLGKSGSGYWRKSTVTNPYSFYHKALEIPTDTDIVTMFGSFNDMGRDGDIRGRDILGTAYDDTTDTVGGCINQTILNVFSRVPNAVVGVILPTPWDRMTLDASELAVYEPYVNLVKAVAERYSLPVLDLFHHSNLRPWDTDFKTAYFLGPNDGDHPNHYGHMRIAGYIADFVESLAKLN